MSKANGLPRGISIRRGKYFVDILVKGERFYGTFATLEVAEEQIKAWKNGLNIDSTKKTQKETSSWTLSKAYEVTKLRRWAGSKAEKTTLINAKDVLHFFGISCLLEQITVERIDSFIDALQKKGNSNATINRKLSALSAMFSMALERGGCQKKPKFSKLKEPEGRIRFLTYDEEALLLQTMQLWGKNDHYEATVCLVDTGMRLGELWKLHSDNIMLGQGPHGIIILYGDDTKNGTTRSIPMTKRVRAILSRRISDPDITGRLWPTASNIWYQKLWNRVAHHLKMDDDPFWVPHILRHTCCSRLVQGGMPLAQVQKWMGHKTITTTMRYAHLAPTGLYGGISLLEQHQQRLDN